MGFPDVEMTDIGEFDANVRNSSLPETIVQGYEDPEMSGV